jgi:hypothetical protein
MVCRLCKRQGRGRGCEGGQEFPITAIPPMAIPTRSHSARHRVMSASDDWGPDATSRRWIGTSTATVPTRTKSMPTAASTASMRAAPPEAMAKTMVGEADDPQGRRDATTRRRGCANPVWKSTGSAARQAGTRSQAIETRLREQSAAACDN